MKKYVCDIETDGLDPSVVWCIGCVDESDGSEHGWDPTTIHLFKDWVAEQRRLHGEVIFVGHNFLSYDAPVLGRLLGVDIGVEQIEDTLIMSRLFDMTLYSHSLEAWGERLGEPKIEFNDWSKYSPAMFKYMIQDCRVNLRLYRYLRSQMDGRWSNFSIRLEHRTQDFLNRMKKNGFPLDINKVYELRKTIDDEQRTLGKDIKEAFPPQLKLVEKYTPKYTKTGEMYAAAVRKIDSYQPHVVRKGNTYELYQMVEFNLASTPQVVERMNQAGWKPVEFTDKGNPKLTETNFETLPPDAPKGAHSISRWMLLSNRLAVIDGWLDAYNPLTKSIHGDVNCIGAVTHRMSHRNPQMANIPAVRNEFGREMRSCLWSGGDPYRMVGVDISGIQLRILAHYLNDPAYTEAVCFGKSEDGTDIHSVHMRILQEVAPHCTRDNAKTYIYAMLLGASGGKLGSILGLDADAGYRTKDTLFRRIPAFKKVQGMCKVAAKRGYMIGIDGRRTPIKSEHYALSAYLQCGEAIIMKQALLFADERIDYPWFPMAVVHDEVQSRVHMDYVDRLGPDLVSCIEEAGRFFELRVPVTGGFNTGNNWAETH